MTINYNDIWIGFTESASPIIPSFSREGTSRCFKAFSSTCRGIFGTPLHVPFTTLIWIDTTLYSVIRLSRYSSCRRLQMVLHSILEFIRKLQHRLWRFRVVRHLRVFQSLNNTNGNEPSSAVTIFPHCKKSDTLLVVRLTVVSCRRNAEAESSEIHRLHGPMQPRAKRYQTIPIGRDH